MKTKLTITALAAMAAFFSASTRAADPPAAPKKPLRIGYSDWPGYVAFEVGLQKGWFKEAGVDVEFSWFDYLPSLDAFSAGKLDAVLTTNGDGLVTGANGAKNKYILITDYSDGNDQIIGQPGVASFKALKGKKVGLELTLVEHLLLLQGLQKNGMKPADIELINFPTNETPQALASGQVSAVGTWYPITGQARKAVAGSKPLFTSADVPGLIYDVLAVNPQSLDKRKDDWAKVTKVWFRIAGFINDPKTRPEAVKIMAGKVNVDPAEYAKNLPGTHILSLTEEKKVFKKAAGLESIYGSSKIANDFNFSNKVYKQSQTVEDYIYPDFVKTM
jgi:NitT/TauT family transport system substrate-binding protein